MGIGTLRRAVFLDRDGVLNEAVVRDGKPYPPATAGEVRVVDGAVEGLRRLKELGFLLIVVTNQPDVGRGTQSLAEVTAINERLGAEMPLDDVLMCLHGGDGCDCRKPRPGLLLAAAERHGIDVAGSYLIGDRWRDVEAAEAAGCPAVWIDYGYNERGPTNRPAAVVKSVREAICWIVEREHL
ncbi:MAG: D-glycero-alpha-D-manno-heptose-1,7-bisphosphate 7-phosphatase [Acidobacteriota bacterium]